MKYAVSNWIYSGEPLPVTFERLARLGYDGVELVGEPSRVDPIQVRQLSKEHGLQVTSILGWCIWGIPGRDPASRDPDERQAAGAYMRSCVDLAVATEAQVVVLLAAPAGRVAPQAKVTTEAEWTAAFGEEWSLAVESARALAAYAADRHILLALEPLNRYESFLVNNVDQALRFLQEVGSDQLRLHLDTFHMNLEEADLASATEQAGGLLVNMHVSDSNRLPPGRGHIDFARLLAALRKIGYQGALVLEPVPPGSDPLLSTSFPGNHRLRDLFAEEGLRHLKGIEAALGI